MQKYVETDLLRADGRKMHFQGAHFSIEEVQWTVHLVIES